MKRVLFILVAVVLLAVGAGYWFRRPTPPPDTGGKPTVLWVFEAPRAGAVVAAPHISPDGIHLSAVHADGFKLQGTVYAIDPDTGRRRWSFDDNGAMLPAASAPASADGRLLFGEGMHANFVCRLRAIDAGSGGPVWSFTANDHIESGPRLRDGRAYFAAGNDGVYCLTAATGQPVWHFTGDLHTDSSPAVEGGRVYVATGPSRRFRTCEVIALDAANGQPRWRTPVSLPAWGSPVAVGDAVYVGLGNGRLTKAAEPPEVPAGGMVRLDAGREGETAWTFRTPDAVFVAPTVLSGVVAFGCRDGHYYGVNADTGTERFRVPMGAAVMADSATDGRVLFACSTAGRVCALSPADGGVLWQYELKDAAHGPVVVYAPLRYADGRLYVAGAVNPNEGFGGVFLFCLTVPNTPPGSAAK